MHIFLSAFDDVPDPRAENARHELGELLVIAFVSVLCGATSCAEMSAFGRAKESIFRDFLKRKHAIPSHDTFSTVFQMIDPKALDAAFGQVLADLTALLREGDVVAVDGKSLRGARERGESARTRMMVSAYASRLRLTLASATADKGTELEAALEVLGLIALNPHYSPGRLDGRSEAVCGRFCLSLGGVFCERQACFSHELSRRLHWQLFRY